MVQMHITSAGEYENSEKPLRDGVFARENRKNWEGAESCRVILSFSHFSAGILALLDEPLADLKVFALKKLDSIVDEFWPEISEAVEKM